MKINISPIYKLIAQGEHQQQDFKFCINDSRKIARSLVAFANTDGGRLLIGVKDNGKIIGVRSDEEYYMLQPDIDFILIMFIDDNWQNFFMSNMGFSPLSGIL